MDTERHRREVELFTAACDLPPAEKAALLERECGGDAGMLARVRALLERDSAGARALELPGLAEVSAELIEEELPERVDRYRILRELGRGGMGVVYEAEQQNPARRVALKMLRPAIEGRRMLRRFEHEARVLGLLSHPGIAQVYDAGFAETRSGRRPYLVMELVQGEPLTRFAARRALDRRRRIELLARVCDAVQHAHDRGVIHRDLKPSNILVGEDELPKVLDFGIARVLDEGPGDPALRTRTGELIGTLAYMSPEQVSGTSGAIDTRSDVYSLGVIAYELLANRLPHALEGVAFPDAARAIAEHEPTRLGSVVRELRGDVETIVAKAMEKERARRYASAGALGLDLRRWLQHEPIAARPTSGLYQLRRFARRNRKLTAALLFAAAALIAGATASWLYALDAREAERTAHEETRRAECNSVRAGLAAAALALEAHDPVAARQLLGSISPSERAWEWRHLLATVDTSALSFEDDAPIGDAMPSPDGEAILTVSSAGRLRRWSARSGALLGTLELAGAPLGACAFSPDGAWLAAVHGNEQRVSVWSTATGALRAETDRAEVATVIAISCAGDVVALGGRRLQLWRPDADAPPSTLGVKGPAALAFDAGGGHRLAVAYGAPPEHGAGWGWYNVLDADTGKFPGKSRQNSDQPILGVALSAGGARIAAASVDRRVYVGDGPALGPGRVLAGHRSQTTCVAFDGPGARIASGSSDQTVRIWDAASGAELGVLTGAASTLRCVRFLPDGSGLVGLAGARIHVWRLAGEPDLGRMDGHSSYVYGIAFLEDGRRLVSCAWDGTLRIWDVRTRECLGSRALGAPRAFAVAAGPAGTWFATAESDRVGLWSADTAERIAQLDWSGKEAVVALAASRDGELLAARSPRRVALWRTRERALERELACPGGDSMSAVALSGDGRWVAADVARSSIVVWDRTSGAEVARLNGHTGRVAELAFSPDGAWLASGAVDADVRLWDTRDWRERAVLAGHTDRVYALAFSPDGARLASGSNDTTVRIWSVPDGMSRGVLRGHRDYVYALAFSPDGECLASASGDASVRLWDSRPDREVWVARERSRELEAAARAALAEDGSGLADEELVERLRADPELDAEELQARLEVVLRRNLSPARAR